MRLRTIRFPPVFSMFRWRIWVHLCPIPRPLFSVPQKSVGVVACDVVVSDAERYNVFERGMGGGAYVSASRFQKLNKDRPPKAD